MDDIKLLGTISKMDKGKTQTNEPGNKNVDYARDFTHEWRYRQTIYVKKRIMKRTHQHWR